MRRLVQGDHAPAALLAAVIVLLGGYIFAQNARYLSAFNVSTVLAENAAYSGTAINQWRVPTTIVTARFAKISVQFDF